MKGSYFLGNRRFEVRSIPQRPLARGEVLIKVAACGVCGTDVHIYHGGKGSATVVPPVVLGHEFSGVVTEVGEGVDSLRSGDRVAVDPNIYCGHCHFCQIGKKQLCTNLQALGVTRDGGFADYCYVPQEQCFRLSDEIPLWWGALAEPLACCMHGVDRVGICPGDTVCVIGGGAIGLLMVQLARLKGASKVILSEPIALRRQIGLQVGADAAIDPVTEPLSQRLRELLGSDGADIVIECVGNPAASAQAFEAADRGAAVLLFGVPKPESTYTLHLEDVYQKELRVVGSMINPDTHGHAVALLNSGRLQIDPLVTHIYPIEQMQEAILKQMETDSIKVIVRVEEEV